MMQDTTCLSLAPLGSRDSRCRGMWGQLLWELHLASPDSTELPNQANTFAASPPYLTSSPLKLCC